MPTGSAPHQTATSAEPARGRARLGLALLITVVQVAGTAVADRGQAVDLDLLAAALLALGALAIALRHPGARLAMAASATVAYHVIDHPTGPTFLGLLVAAGVTIKEGRRSTVWITALVSIGAWLALADVSVSRALAVLGWSLGLLLLTELALAAARTIRHMLQEEERLKEERRLRRATEERLRIAAELHDVLGHHLSLINVRAGVGGHLIERNPQEALAALQTIKKASAEALREVQSVLQSLHPTETAAPRAPAPGLERLADLTGDAGLPLQMSIEGDLRPVPPEVDRAAYRIVQEALTNVRRHAGPTSTVAVKIVYTEDDLVVRVDDDGAPAVRSGLATDAGTAKVGSLGIGIAGMRERATALGGTLVAGPLVPHGWRVEARLPLGPTEPETAR